MPRRTIAIVAALAAAFVAAGVLVELVGWRLAGHAPPRFAWFYRPPGDETPVETIARAHDLVVLTFGDEDYRAELRRAGYEGDVLQYVSLAVAFGPADVGSPCDDAYVSPMPNQVAWTEGDFCRHLHGNEDWFLHNGAGERLYRAVERGRLYAMNPASEGWRRFFAARVAAALGSDGLGYDGLFLDEVWGTRHVLENDLTNSDGSVREYGSDRALYADVRAFVEVVRDATDVPVYGNPAPQREHGAFADVLDGFMVENFAASWHGEYMDADEVERVWEVTREAAGDEKDVILVGQGPKDDLDRARFAYGAYLMASHDHVLFRYHQAHDYRTLWWYPAFDVDLGKARNDRVHVTGDVWARGFEHGAVVVNLGEKEAAVELPDEVDTPAGVPRSLTLGAHEAALLTPNAG